jgi:hypothetical protein
MNTVLLTSVSNYTPANISNFIHSVNKSGFNGEKVAFVFTSQSSTISYLQNNGFTVLFPSAEPTDWGYAHIQPSNYPPKNIFCDRFLHYSRYLVDNPQFLYCISSDCRDVVFQLDPSILLVEVLAHSGKDLIVSLEDIEYPLEDWNSTNLKLNFPEFYENLQGQQIANAGVIAGRSDVVRELFQTIYLTSLGGRMHSRIRLTSTDQSAYNILLSQNVWSQRSFFASNADPWAAQIGSYASKLDLYHSRGLPVPRLQDEKIVNTLGKPYAIVHQYDRMPDWKDAINSIYSGYSSSLR